MIRRFWPIFGRTTEPKPLTEKKPDDGEERSEGEVDRYAEKAKSIGWIGVDLDGTLAEYREWRGIHHIGEPIPLMRERVMYWIEQGYRVKIVTARASVPEGPPFVRKWLAKHGFPELEVTNEKDFQMIELWDDRAVRVMSNTGNPVSSVGPNCLPVAPLLPDEANGRQE